MSTTACKIDYLRDSAELQAGLARTRAGELLLKFSQRRIIHSISDVYDELRGKSLLVLGSIDGAFEDFVEEANVNIRRVCLIEDCVVQFKVDIFHAEGIAEEKTLFSKEAFCGIWDFMIAYKSPIENLIGLEAVTILRRSRVTVHANELLLLTPPSNLA